VKYEDLKAEPEVWFTKILEKMEYEVDPERVRDAIQKTELSRLRKLEEENGFDENPGKNLFFGGKREKPTLLHRMEIEKACRDQMIELGYLFDERLAI
jgi:hypothetical protein